MVVVVVVLVLLVLEVGATGAPQSYACTSSTLTLIVAAVALPLLVTVPFLDGLAAAVVHLFIGLPILALTSAFSATLRR